MPRLAKYKTIEIEVARIPLSMVNPKTALKEKYYLEAPVVSKYDSGDSHVTRVSLEDRFIHLGRGIKTKFPTTKKNGYTSYPVETEGLVTGIRKVKIPNRDFTNIVHPVLACIAKGEVSVNRLVKVDD